METTSKTFTLNLDVDGRYLSSCDSSIWSPEGYPVVDSFPTGETEAEQNLHNWRYVDEQWIYDPLPEPEPVEPEPTADEVLDVLLGVSE